MSVKRRVIEPDATSSALLRGSLRVAGKEAASKNKLLVMNYANKIKNYALCFSITFFIGCSNYENPNRQATKAVCDTVLNLDSSSVRMINVINEGNRINPTFKYIQLDLEGTKLMNYKSGYDSIAIRLWYDYDSDEKDVIEIRKHCDGWVGEYTKIVSYLDNGKVYNKIGEKRNLYPKSGWDLFTKKIFGLGIITLPDFGDIPDYNPASDGNSIDVEIATKEYYRVYTYLQPRTKKRDIKEANTLETILKLIEAEFDFKPVTEI